MQQPLNNVRVALADSFVHEQPHQHDKEAEQLLLAEALRLPVDESDIESVEDAKVQIRRLRRLLHARNGRTAAELERRCGGGSGGSGSSSGGGTGGGSGTGFITFVPGDPNHCAKLNLA
jgi:uncharacterized membrane protein YgcG